MTAAYQSEFIELCMQLGVLRFGKRDARDAHDAV